MNDVTVESGPRPEDSETQQKILAAARAEFAAHGKAGGRIDRIAAGAGVNKAMIYYHYSSKDKLYLEAVFSVLSDARASFASALTQGQTIEDALLAIALIYQRLFETSPEYRAMMLRELANANSPVIVMLAERFAATGMPAQLTGLLQQEIDSGRMRAVDVRQALVSFLMMNIGYYLAAPMVGRVMGVVDPVTFAAGRPHAIVDLFLNGMRTRV